MAAELDQMICEDPFQLKSLRDSMKERETSERKKNLSQDGEWCSGICWNQAHDKRRIFKTFTEKLSRIKGNFPVSTVF